MVKLTEYANNEFMVVVSKDEAMEIVENLAHQINNNNCNMGRKEFFGRNEEEPTYFSIAVQEKVQEEKSESVFARYARMMEKGEKVIPLGVNGINEI